ncbi:uncharacterized protein KD926_000770 [Aspergillus affinis]|uniref:uncharacterized protein n=1 Tax=Aspergillus affinis TaxID=1070780 RepID=UPI0022FF0CAD|nr:uncharacterized protein KD926_000770 [Aspergillus affinis]KAI9037197.1 hypothetical protein KD926_000770 [Aspergillus affinis]
MDQSWPIQMFGDLPFFRWEDLNSDAPTSAPNYPSIQESAAGSDIPSLLPTRSCPPPESYVSQPPQSQESRLPSDAVPSDHSRRQKTAKAALSKSTPRRSMRSPGRQSKTGAAAIQEPGNPRKHVTKSSNVAPDERRRTQLRLAQRAYRTRQQATVKGLETRISRLETVLESMSSTVLSFSAELLESGVLESYSGLTESLRDAIKTVLSLASEPSPGSRAPIPDEPSQSEEAEDPSPSSDLAPTTGSLPSISFPAALGHDPPHFTDADDFRTVSSPATASIGLSEFIHRLHVEALYQSYLALSNHAIGLHQLQRPFGFALSMLDRGTLASYFKAELDAIANRKPLDGWEAVPLFSLGGAGTHYPRPASMQTRTEGRPSYSHRRRGTRAVSLARVAPDVLGTFEGTWFDLHDLEGFLLEKDVLLLLPTDDPSTGSSSTQTSINVARLIPGILGAPADISGQMILTLHSINHMPLLDSDIAVAKKVFDVNVFAVVAVTQAFAPLLIASKGTVINIGSVLGKMPLPWQGFYKASKAAVALITDQMPIELSTWGVDAILVNTGAIKTHFFDNLASQPVLPEDSRYYPAKGVIEPALAGSEVEGNAIQVDSYAEIVVNNAIRSDPKKHL